MSDLIDRKMAIDAIEEMQMPIMRSGSPIDQSVFTGMGRALQAIKDLPSAQPVNYGSTKTDSSSQLKLDNDLISRQDVLNELDGCDYELKDWQRWKLKTMVRGIPSAQPQRKTGKWIKISPANIYECSECGKNVMTDDISAYDFCHGCGADMRGEIDE